MQHTLCCAIVGALMAIAMPAISEADTLESIETQLTERWSRISGFSATMHVEVDMTRSRIRVRSDMSGPLLVQRTENGVTRHRSELAGRTKAGPLGLLRADAEVLTVSTGDVTFTEQRVRDEIKVTRSKRPDPTAPGGGDRISSMKDRYTLRALPRERIGGREALVIEARSRNPKDEPVDRIRMFFDADTGIQLRITMFDDRGREITKVSFRDIRINPIIEDDAFEYAPPEGVPITEKEAE